jgi:dCTP deaminase
MVLSDRDIRTAIEDGDLLVEPYEPENIEPASMDLRIGSQFNVAKLDPFEPVSLSNDESPSFSTEWDSVTVKRGQFVLASTLEHVIIPDNLCGKVLGRSSLGRLGVSIHQTAGYIDPGFDGQITLEIVNNGPAPVTIEGGQRVCQIVFERLSSSAEEPYGHADSQYQYQNGPTESGMQFE